MVGTGIQLGVPSSAGQPCKTLSRRKSLPKGAYGVCGMLGFFLGLLEFLLFLLNLGMVCFRSRKSGEGIQQSRFSSILILVLSLYKRKFLHLFAFFQLVPKKNPFVSKQGACDSCFDSNAK